MYEKWMSAHDICDQLCASKDHVDAVINDLFGEFEDDIEGYQKVVVIDSPFENCEKIPIIFYSTNAFYMIKQRLVNFGFISIDR